MAEDAFKQFAKMELVKVCEPLYIFIINIEILYEDIVSVPLVVGEFLIGPQKRRGIHNRHTLFSDTTFVIRENS